jgi:hypothetical protein
LPDGSANTARPGSKPAGGSAIDLIATVDWRDCPGRSSEMGRKGEDSCTLAGPVKIDWGDFDAGVGAGCGASA